MFYCPEGGVEIELPVMIEDRSKSGLGIRVRRSVDQGCTVRIQQGSRVYTGVVRNCRRSNLDYFVGIELKNNAEDGTR